MLEYASFNSRYVCSSRFLSPTLKLMQQDNRFHMLRELRVDRICGGVGTDDDRPPLLHGTSRLGARCHCRTG